MLVILTQIAERSVTPLCSTYLHVIGDEVAWDDITTMFAGSGQSWDGAAFFPTKAANGGPVDNPTARLRLSELEAKVTEDRMILNEGHFFDTLGRRIKIEPRGRRMTAPIRILDTGLRPARWNVAMTAALAARHADGAAPDTVRFHRYPACVLLGRSQVAAEAVDLELLPARAASRSCIA